MRKKTKAIIIISLLINSISQVNAKEILHTEKSLYRNISIEQRDNLLCMVFESHKEPPPFQTCVDQKEPKKLIFSYTKLILSGLLYKSNPNRILIIGLGGGTLPVTLSELLPDAEIVSVEIDPAVIKLAKQYFNYSENERVKTVERDGRLFIKRAMLKKEHFDWIILDAFNGDYIPEHLMTQEFLTEVKSVLAEDGIITANTFSNSELYAYESATYHSVFGDFYNIKRPRTGNRIILATKNQSLLPISELRLNANHWRKHFKTLDVDIRWLLDHVGDQKDWDPESEILTDQYSPANLLKFEGKR